MSVTAAELGVKVKWDDSEVKKGTADTDSHVKGWGSKMSAGMLAVGTAGGTLLAEGLTSAISGARQGIVDSINIASDINESMSKVGELFGPATDSIVQWSEGAATNLGMSKLAAMDAASTFATFGKAAGLAGTDLSDFATKNAAMATDFASFFNTSPEEAVEKIGAAFRGESEPIRSFGILLDANSVKAKALSLGLVQGEVDTLKLSRAQETAEKALRTLNDATSKYGEGSQQHADALRDLEQAQTAVGAVMAGTVPDLTAQQKIMATQALIAEQGSSALGDFARTSDGLANQQRILAANVENVKGKIGEALLPVVLKFTSFLNSSVIPTLQAWSEKYGPAIEDALQRMGRWISNIIDLFRSGNWQEALSSIGQKIFDLWLGAERWMFTVAIPAMGRALVSMGKAFGTWITETAIPFLQENLPIWLDSLSAWVNGTALPWLQEKGLELAKMLGSWIGAAAEYLLENLPDWLSAFGGWFTGDVLPWLGEQLLNIAKQMGEWVGDAAGYLKENLPKWIGAFVEWVVGDALPSIIVQTAKFTVKLGEWVVEAAAELPGKLAGWIVSFNVWAATEAMPMLIDFGLDILGWIGDGLLGANDFLFDTGQEIVNGLIDGLWSMAGKLKSEVESFITSNIPDPVRAILEMRSPSKVFVQFGQNIVEGLAIGLTSDQFKASQATEKMMTNFFGNNLRTVPMGAGQQAVTYGNNEINVSITMPPGSNGNDVVRALTEWSRHNGPVPIRTR